MIRKIEYNYNSYFIYILREGEWRELHNEA
jgi:hypothetical protein